MTKPEPAKKGITFSIEKIDDSNNYIIKKYVNGKLNKQKVVSNKKLKYLVQKQVKKLKNKTAKKGGKGKGDGLREAEKVQKVEVHVQDKTFVQNMKEGAAFGLGWELMETAIESIFNSD